MTPSPNPGTPVKFDDLRSALEWVSASPDEENQAYVSRVTGVVHWSSTFTDLEEELPEDIEDGSLYVSVPHKNALGLGRDLAIAFTEEHLKGSVHVVEDFFHKRGAYAKFKDLLERESLLQAWYDHEAGKTESALRAWAAGQDLSIAPEAGPKSDGPR
jgi:hypothetical protein